MIYYDLTDHDRSQVTKLEEPIAPTSTTQMEMVVWMAEF